MGITITTKSLDQKNVCSEAVNFFKQTFCISGSEFYISGSNNECYFEDNIIYNFTCSNSDQVDWLIKASNIFGITGSFYNTETNKSQLYHRIRPNSNINLLISGSEPYTEYDDNGNILNHYTGSESSGSGSL
tara:strand:+ start:654 stop:1049 length:396 start_codon:yes stop_codon:yes gene_type:complete